MLPTPTRPVAAHCRLLLPLARSCPIDPCYVRTLAALPATDLPHVLPLCTAEVADLFQLHFYNSVPPKTSCSTAYMRLLHRPVFLLASPSCKSFRFIHVRLEPNAGYCSPSDALGPPTRSLARDFLSLSIALILLTLQ